VRGKDDDINNSNINCPVLTGPESGRWKIPRSQNISSFSYYFEN